uniref:Mitochondrial import inner membrane translocase subunit TIM44 n=1 Tax=Aceria tosichella TaxID=561515 RepID=A0A6G1S7N3_9ACAR
MLSRLSYLPRRYSSQKSFVSRVIENIRNEWSQNKEIKENLDKFRRETQKLEDTDALRQAREKFKKVEEESLKDVNEVLQSAKDSLRSGVEKAKEAEIVKKTIRFGDTISSTAKDAAQGISKQGEYLKETTAFKKMSEASRSVERELNEADMLSSLYKPPTELLKRSERSTLMPQTERQVKPNEDVQSIELHKDSKWSQNWSKFKDENPYINKIFEFKMKYDESDNPLVRATKTFVDRVGDIMGGLFQRTDLSNVLTEICKADPNFDINVFMNDCEKFIIPTILEAMVQNRLDILADWCHEAVYNVLSRPLQEAQKLGLTIHTKVLDLQNLELAMGKMMEQGPVLVFTFHAQQISYVTDSKGNIVEGDPDKIVQNTYVMAFCRDQDDLDPSTAWRLIDVAMQQSQIFF